MRKKQSFVTAAIFGFILCVAAQAEIELSKNMETDLIAGPPATLAGIDELHLVIIPPSSEPNMNRPLWRNLDSTVRDKLTKAGIKIVPLTYPIGKNRPENLRNIPELKVHVDTLRLSEPQQYVFTVWLSIASEVSLIRQSNHRVMADVWKINPTLTMVQEQDMPAKISAAVTQQVELFIEAFLAANPPGKKLPGATSLTGTAEKETNPAVNRTAANYLFVASKNSDVFHRPECRSVQRISASNLVRYQTREEAIAAGKRPCKTCKP